VHLYVIMFNINVLGVAHTDDVQYIKYIWWYDVVNDFFDGCELGKRVRRHLNIKGIDRDGIVKGRVVLFGGEYYLMIHTVGYKAHSEFVVSRIVEAISNKFLVHFVINESGELLLNR